MSLSQFRVVPSFAITEQPGQVYAHKDAQSCRGRCYALCMLSSNTSSIYLQVGTVPRSIQTSLYYVLNSSWEVASLTLNTSQYNFLITEGFFFNHFSFKKSSF